MGGEDPHASRNRKLSRKPKYSRFTQQELPDWKPLLTPTWFIVTVFVIGILFIPIGFACLSASKKVVEIVDQYDKDCIIGNTTADWLAYIKDPTSGKKCFRSLKVPKKMKSPVFVYYELQNFYQNHRRYVESRSDKQLHSKSFEGEVAKCNLVRATSGNVSEPIVPCGLVAWTLFNDTYSFSANQSALHFSSEGIVWFHEKVYKYGKDVYPKNFQSGDMVGGGKLDESKPLSQQENFIVWMRAAPLPKFRKLYGIILDDLEADQTIDVLIENNYNTYEFDGSKKLVLSTASWLGGKNVFLGKAYVAFGGLSLIMATILIILYIFKPRNFGDPSLLSWKKNFTDF